MSIYLLKRIINLLIFIICISFIYAQDNGRFYNALQLTKKNNKKVKNILINKQVKIEYYDNNNIITEIGKIKTITRQSIVLFSNGYLHLVPIAAIKNIKRKRGRFKNFFSKKDKVIETSENNILQFDDEDYSSFSTIDEYENDEEFISFLIKLAVIGTALIVVLVVYTVGTIITLSFSLLDKTFNAFDYELKPIFLPKLSKKYDTYEKIEESHEFYKY